MTQSPPKGGEFLLKKVTDGSIFIPENLDEQQKALGQTTFDFFNNEVLPKGESIEKQEEGVSVGLLKKAGELGLLMAEIPENYGGLGLDKRCATVISEKSTSQGSFTVTFMCHTGIGTLPILYFGNEEQKAKYLPKLASGEYVGAYCLTEAGSGSDALAAKTKATLSEDGKHYILNGAKMWITNGRWADVFTVFAKVDGEKFTAFIVERGFEGLSHAAEEKKMGIKGSSTVVINLDNCKVPVENVLGEVGKGHKIAFNVLNIGRWKLGAACVGGSKRVLKDMITYIIERKQFGKSLSDFGLIRKKVADSSITIFAMESMMYRIAGLYDEAIAQLDKNDADYDRKSIEAIEDYAIEASIAKVFGSEGLWMIADEGVQALGGYGFSQEYPMEATQRDCRINRIFEGTNEINRLIIPGTLLKRAMKGQIDLMGAVTAIVSELKEGFDAQTTGEFGQGAYIARVELAKKLTVYAAGVAVQKYMNEIQNQQYIMEKIADLAIEAFKMDSSLKRTLQLLDISEKSEEVVPFGNYQTAVECTKVIVSDGYEKVLQLAKTLLVEIANGNAEEYAKYKKALGRFEIFEPIPTVGLMESIANQTISQGEYSV